MTMICGSDKIPHDILGYFPHSDETWKTFRNIPWNIVSPTDIVTNLAI